MPRNQPVTWRCLARSGLTVFGPSPTELDIADDENLLRSYQIENVRSYWKPWIDECDLALAAKAPGEDCDAAALAWGVLGISRIAGSLETKRVLSKVEGGRHAIAVQQACWHPIIRKAMSAHFGTLKRVPIKTVVDGLAYMRAVAGQVARAG